MTGREQLRIKYTAYDEDEPYDWTGHHSKPAGQGQGKIHTGTPPVIAFTGLHREYVLGWVKNISSKQ